MRRTKCFTTSISEKQETQWTPDCLLATSLVDLWDNEDPWVWSIRNCNIWCSSLGKDPLSFHISKKKRNNRAENRICWINELSCKKALKSFFLKCVTILFLWTMIHCACSSSQAIRNDLPSAGTVSLIVIFTFLSTGALSGANGLRRLFITRSHRWILQGCFALCLALLLLLCITSLMKSRPACVHVSHPSGEKRSWGICSFFSLPFRTERGCFSKMCSWRLQEWL